MTFDEHLEHQAVIRLKTQGPSENYLRCSKRKRRNKGSESSFLRKSAFQGTCTEAFHDGMKYTSNFPK